MSKKLFPTILFLCSFFSHYLFAQSSCGTKVSDTQISEMIAHNQRHALLNQRLSATTIYVPVSVHIITKSDGTGGNSFANVLKDITYTNNAFASLNVQFYICGKIQYINSTEFYSISETTEAKYASAYDVSNRCNIYYGGTVSSGGVTYGGYAYLPGGPQRIMLSNNSSGSDNLLPHEMGHFFGLVHTFSGSSSTTVSQREKVTRGAGANCTTSGDFLCDTPADPYIFGDNNYKNYFDGCIYTEQHFDVNGEKFVPMLNNTMSYYFGCDKRAFTQGQYGVMQSYLTDASRSGFVCNSATVNAPTNLTAVGSKYGIQLSWNDNSTNEIGFTVEYSNSLTGNYSGFTVDSNTTTAPFGNILPNTTYYFRVKPINSASGYSNTATYITGLEYCVPASNTNCIGFGTSKFQIATVKIEAETILNNTSQCADKSFDLYSTVKPKLFKTVTYKLDVAQALNESGSATSLIMAAWVDWNNNAIFEATEKVVLKEYSFGKFAVALKMPGNTTNGVKRLRIRVGNNSSNTIMEPCSDITYGETEDYLIEVTDLPQTLPLKLTASQKSTYANSISWTNTTLPATAVCTIFKSVNDSIYSLVDSVKAQNGTYTDFVERNANYKYLIRLKSDNSLVSNIASVDFAGYKIPYQLSGSISGNRAALVWTGDTTTIKRALLYASYDGYPAYYSLKDTITTGKLYYEDYQISNTATTRNYKIVSLTGNHAISNVINLDLAPLKACLPAFTNTTCIYKDGFVDFDLGGGWSTSIYNGCSAGATMFKESSRNIDLLKKTAYGFELVNDLNCYYFNKPQTSSVNAAIWIDLNEDNKFTANEKIYQNTAGSYLCGAVIPFTISDTVDGGAKRVRIIITAKDVAISDPCGKYTNGEGSDFFINILAPSKKTTVDVQDLMISQEQINIYPNPTEDGNLTIASDHALKSVDIYDVQGNLISNQTDNAISGLKSGLYLIKILTETDHHATLKVIVK